MWLGMLNLVPGLVIFGLLFAYVIIPTFIILDLAAEARERGDSVPLIVTLGIAIAIVASVLGLFLYSVVYDWLRPRNLPPR